MLNRFYCSKKCWNIVLKKINTLIKELKVIIKKDEKTKLKIKITKCFYSIKN